MPKLYRFKNEGVKRLLEISRRYKEFLIPYEDDKTRPQLTLWVVKDAGLYLALSAKIGEKEYKKLRKDKSHVHYAEGAGEDVHISGDDFIEEIELTTNLIKHIEEGKDIGLKFQGKYRDIITYEKRPMSELKEIPNSQNNKTETMKKNTKELKNSGKAPEITKQVPNDGTKKKDSANLSKKEKRKLAEANVSAAGKKAVEEKVERSTKYIYGEDCTTATKKKEFRRKARAAISSFEKKLRQLKKSTDEKDQKELKQVEKEFAAWKTSHLTPDESVKG